MAQPGDHPPAGGLLHHLLTLTIPHRGKAGGAVIFFYRHLLSPIASIFGSGMPYAARTFLSHPPVENASDKPEHCFRNAKIAKKFDLTANFSEFLNSFRFLGMILLLSHPERLTFQSSFSLIPFTFVCISRSFNFIYKTIIFLKSSK